MLELQINYLVLSGGMVMNRRIGVLDTGVGGLSVVRSLQKVLPQENILYFGDSKNVPYGNKEEDEILYLTMKMLNFMKENNVKVVVIACNTVSSLLNKYKDKFKYPIFDIITPTVEYLLDLKVNDLAIMGTEFTIKTGIYQKLLIKGNKRISIISESSKVLAALVDSGDFTSAIIKDTIKFHLDNIFKKKRVTDIVLVCTHYPIVQELFAEITPNINYIDPGYQQALAVKEYLLKNDLLNKKGGGLLSIYTSGEKKIYLKIKDKLRLINLIELIEMKL